MPVRVLALGPGIATVEDREGRRADVPTDFVPEARAGDILLVHGGVAIARVEETA